MRQKKTLKLDTHDSQIEKKTLTILENYYIYSPDYLISKNPKNTINQTVYQYHYYNHPSILHLALSAGDTKVTLRSFHPSNTIHINL